MRIVFASAEVSPIAKTGGLGDVCGSLPKALRRLGHDVVVFMPWYRQAREWFAKNEQTVYPALPTTRISWANWSHEATFLRSVLPGTDIPLILVANDYFFDRQHLYSGRLDGFDDYVERYAYFCRSVIRGCELLDIHVDILHAHDWHTALLPVYLHSGLRGSHQFRNAHSVFTIHNLNYQGIASSSAFGVLGLHERYWAPDALEHFGNLNLMKGGLLFGEQVTTVSPNYSREIRTPQFGAGLDGVLRAVSPRLNGILNGIDADEWNPATDPYLAGHFSADHLRGKATAKHALLKEAGLRGRDRAPLLGVVSRLVDQKGFQLLLPVLDKLLAAGAQAVILGSGERHYEEGFARIAAAHPENCRTWIGFDNALAHRIYGGSDLLLMPSIYEPCGLNQMYALRYGTLPVVRMTGGLADTVAPFDGTNAERSTGFGFASTDPWDLYTATLIGMLTYRDQHLWKTFQSNGMEQDFSWERSAREYDSVYRFAAGW